MKNLLFVACIALMGTVPAFSPKFVGYCGNSGTEKEPVVFGMPGRGDAHGQQTQCGPVYDKETGLIYASAGCDRINAYAVDGRLAATYSIPKGYFRHSGDPLVREGANLYFRRNKQMWHLPLNATNGTAAVKANCKLKNIALAASSARNGELVLWLEDKSLHMWNIASGETRPFGSVDIPGLNSFEWNAKGELIAFNGNSAHKIVDGKVVNGDGWPKKLIGRGIPMMNCSATGGAIFTTSHKGGIIRINGETVSLDPGVVFGGAGGHTLAYVYFDNDIGLGGGVEHLEGDYYAVLGQRGAIVIMKHDAKLNQFVRVRRIGAVPEDRVLNLSDEGEILCGSIVWRWSDAENAFTYTSRSLGSAALSERVGRDVLTLGTWSFWPGIMIGSFKEVGGRPAIRQKGIGQFSDKSVGAACVGGRKLYVLDKDGNCHSYDFWHNRHKMSVQNEKPVELKLSRSGKNFTGLTLMRDDLLVLACDGEVVFVKPEGETLTEISRFKKTFDVQCRVAVDSKHILVSEKVKNCVTVFDEKGGVIYRFDVPSPGAAAINGNRLVIHDTRNQRILKYEIVD